MAARGGGPMFGVTGKKKVRINPDWHVKVLVPMTADYIEYLCKQMVATVQKMIDQEKPAGRLYRRPPPRKWHRASAPGQVPAIDYGNLRKQVTYWLATVGHSPAGFVGVATAEMKKRVVWLEFGTRRMKPRPLWRPALAAVYGMKGKRTGAGSRWKPAT